MNKIKIILFVTIIVQTCSMLADDNSARRFASLETDPVICKYFLLSTKQIQESLKLTQQQIGSLEFAMLGSTTSNPANLELRNSQKQLLAVAHSDEERSKIRRAGNEKWHVLINQEWEVTLQRTLTPTQTENLEQFLLQMKGPHSILEDTNLFRRLNLAKEQIDQLNQTADSHNLLLNLLRHRNLGLQIQPSRKRSEPDVNSEIESVVRVIKEVEKDQDSELLAVLNKEQRRLWNSLLGASVSIDWKIQGFAEHPFEKNSKEAVNDGDKP